MSYQDPSSSPGQQYPAPPYSAQPYPGQPPASQRTNTLAIVALVLAFFVSLGAVICGHIALAQIKRTGEQGRGLAIAALVLGYIGIAVGVLVVVLYIGIFASVAANGGFNS